MSTTLNPYLSFRDTALQAMTFYQGVFGGQVVTSTFGEYDASANPSEDNLVMHSQLTSPGGLVLMASDTPESMDLTPGNNVSISLSGTDETELRGYWEKLTDGATVTVPLERAPWGDQFGMCIDVFGINWLVNIVDIDEGSQE